MNSRLKSALNKFRQQEKLELDFCYQGGEQDAVFCAMEFYKALPIWQPIETAPKDKYFLVYNGYWTGLGMKQDDDNEEDILYVDEHHEFIEPQPTHWMPLPEPPEERD